MTDITLIGKGYREGLLFKRANQTKSLLTEALENKDESDDQIFSQFSTLHEALFWLAVPNKYDLPKNYSAELSLLEGKRNELERFKNKLYKIYTIKN